MQLQASLSMQLHVSLLCFSLFTFVLGTVAAEALWHAIAYAVTSCRALWKAN